MSGYDELERWFRDVIAWLRGKGVHGERLVLVVQEEVGGEVTHLTGTPPDQ